MKRLLLILLLVFPLSCYDGLSDMLDDVTMKVPICVDETGGDDGNDGRGWRNAKATIGAAVGIAEDGDEIWVAGTQNITATVTIDKPLSFYGGFKGNERRVEQRNPETNISSVNGGSDWFEINSNINVLFDGLTFTGFDDRVIVIQGGGDVTTRDCKFNSNNGGGVISALGSNYQAENCEFRNNTATAGNGGAIFLNNSTAEIRNSIFDNNSAESGGAIFVYNESTVTIDNSEFTRHTAAGQGGAIYADTSTLAISRSKFGDKDTVDSGNSAPVGGAIYVINSENDGKGVTISDNSEFYRNSATNPGGAIYAFSSELTIKNSSFENNESTGASSQGGAIYASISDLTIENSEFVHNDGGNFGGAISVYASTLAINRSKFGDKDTVDSGNGVTGQGGAIYASLGSALIIDNTQFYRNKAIVTPANTGSGGAIGADGNLNIQISNSVFGSEIPDSGNTAGQYGGAISISNGAKVTVEGTDFINSFAASGAGGGGAVYAVGADSSLIIMNGSRFIKNQGHAGGAVFINDTGSPALSVSDSSFKENYASGGDGGAINYVSSHDLNISRSEFTGNTSTNIGGGLNINSSGTVTIDSSIISGNTIINTAPPATPQGGGIYLKTATLNVTNTTISLNEVSNTNGSVEGGGVFQQSGTSSFTNTLFSGNKADGAFSYGGAIYVVESGETVISACKFISNEAHNGVSGDSGGGAVYFNQSSKSTIVNSYFYDNRAYWGGAVYIGGDWGGSYDHALVNLTFYKNSANLTNGTGGAIFMRSVCDVYNSVFYGNTASSGLSIERYDLNSYNLFNCYFDGGMGAGIIAHSCTDSSADPFASTNFGSSNFLYPASGSGLINNGTTTFPLSIDHFTMPLTDLAGNNREVGTIDIGAYERQ